MKTTAISKLKASLSQFLAHVKGGEEVVVTERGRPIAKIVPLQRNDDIILAQLAALERSGSVRIGSGKIPTGFWKLPRPRDRKGLALKALLKEREESR